MRAYAVIVAAEYGPAVKAGGLGDVVSGLSRELEIRGNAVEIIQPKSASMRYFDIWGLAPSCSCPPHTVKSEAMSTYRKLGSLHTTRRWPGPASWAPGAMRPVCFVALARLRETRPSPFRPSPRCRGEPLRSGTKLAAVLRVVDRVDDG
jgi:hypothetical protein